MIHPEITGCSDFGVRHCMQIKYEEDATEWELFPHPIEGFDFEPGYDYVLDVRVTVTNTAPKYELVKIITKTLH